MAEGGWDREQFAGGRARVLLDAMAYFENQRRNRGRAGMTPRTPNVKENRQEEGHMPCGRAWALMVLEPHPGAFLQGGEEAEASLLQLPPHLLPLYPDLQGVGEAESSLSLSPLCHLDL